ncbi:hypothetical protein [Azospirillum sp.]|uniref:hypothetical protein n=1 Tax=Azospirillum sp. TaxID=34012 RepID=UPI003D719837
MRVPLLLVGLSIVLPAAASAGDFASTRSVGCPTVETFAKGPAPCIHRATGAGSIFGQPGRDYIPFWPQTAVQPGVGATLPGTLPARSVGCSGRNLCAETTVSPALAAKR